LRTGMDVVLMLCGHCEGAHRAKLGGPVTAASGLSGFQMSPQLSCMGGVGVACTTRMVENHVLYRVFRDSGVAETEPPMDRPPWLGPHIADLCTECKVRILTAVEKGEGGGALCEFCSH